MGNGELLVRVKVLEARLAEVHEAAALLVGALEQLGRLTEKLVDHLGLEAVFADDQGNIEFRAKEAENVD